MAHKQFYIGLMSGTSMDAVDAVLLAVSGDAPAFEVVGHHAVTMPPALRKEIHQLSHPGQDSVARLGCADVAVARLFARSARELLAKYRLQSSAVAAIGSHGQTIRHTPPSVEDEHPFTLQIGDPSTIAAATGIVTVADFRRKDVALGGEGAPLAPGFHEAVFRSADANRAVVNIGGIANVTWLPSTASKDPVLGFDTGPGNCLMDGWIQRHRGLAYDDNGAWARSGAPVPELLEVLLDEPYLAMAAPKSTGKERFNLTWLERHLERLPASRPANVQATLSVYTALTVANGLRQIAGEQDIDEVYLCGGGALNGHLVSELALRLPQTAVTTTAARGLDPMHIEAAAFAWLAHRTLNGLPGNLPPVTGACRPAILGGIYHP